jgi:hypothetical protein
VYDRFEEGRLNTWRKGLQLKLLLTNPTRDLVDAAIIGSKEYWRRTMYGFAGDHGEIEGNDYVTI